MKRRPPKPLTIHVCPPEQHEIKEWSLEKSLDKQYEILATLGRGRIGVVHHARRLSDGEQVALKFARSDHFELVELEYALLKSLNHPHIINCYDRIPLESMKQEVLVIEYFEGRSLQEITKKGCIVEEGRARAIFLALLSAVAYLHGSNIVHRDIKGDNVLVCKDLSDVRLIDFNVSRRVQNEETPLTMTGTNIWSAPEVLMGRSPSKPNDVWGMGLCLHLMVFGKLPCSWEYIHISTYVTRLEKIATALKQMSSQIASNECVFVLGRCLEVDRSIRAQAQSLLQSNPFKSPEQCRGVCSLDGSEVTEWPIINV